MFVKKGIFQKSLLAIIFSTVGMASSNAISQAHLFEPVNNFTNINAALSALHIPEDSYPSYKEILETAVDLMKKSAVEHGSHEEMIALNKRHTTYSDAFAYIDQHQGDLPVRSMHTEGLRQEDSPSHVSSEQNNDQQSDNQQGGSQPGNQQTGIQPNNQQTGIQPNNQQAGIQPGIQQTESQSGKQQTPSSKTDKQPETSRASLTPTENQASTLFSTGLNQTLTTFTTQSMSQHGATISSFRTGRLLTQVKLQDVETGELQASTGRITNTFSSPVREGGVYSYGQMYGFKMDQGKVNDTAGFNTNGYGIEVGLLKQFTPEWTIGVMIGIQKIDSRFKETSSQLNAQNFRIGPFVAWNHGDWHLNGALTYGITNINNKRTDPLDSIQYHSSPKSREWTAYASAGFDFRLDNLLTGLILTPNVELIYIHNTVDSFNEKGDGKRALKIEKQSSQGWVVRTGLNLNWTLPDVESSKQLRAGIGYQNSFLRDSKISFGFADQSGIQSLKAGDYGRKSFYYNLGYSQNLKNDQNIHIDYFGSTGNKSQSHAIALTYEMKF